MLDAFFTKVNSYFLNAKMFLKVKICPVQINWLPQSCHRTGRRKPV
jgi:hypothetical protein